MSAIEKNLYTGGASAVLATDRRDFYIQPQVVKELVSRESPFLTTLANGPKMTGLKDPMFKMFQHTNPTVRQYIYVTTGATSAADDAEDTIAISSTNSIGLPTTFNAALKGLKCDVFASDGKTTPKPVTPCLGTVVITTFTSATAVNVKNATGASITIPTPAFLEVIGTEFGEASEAPDSWADELSVVWNQCGIQRTAFQLSKVLMDAYLRGESKEYDRVKALKAYEHKIQNARNLLFSASPLGTKLNQTGGDTFVDKKLTDTDGNAMRPTYGLFQSVLDNAITDITNIDCNIFDIPEASYQYNDFVDQSEIAFEYSRTGQETIFCGRHFASYWSKLSGPSGLAAKSKWQVQLSNFQGDKLGFDFKLLDTPNGVYKLVIDPAMTKSPYNGYGFSPDANNSFFVEYAAPIYAQNIKTDNNPLYQKNEYVSQMAGGLTNLPSHKIWRLI